MNKFVIKPKRDFGRYGYLIKGKMVKSGFVVTPSNIGVLILPGAVWFQTVADAMKGIKCWIEAGGNINATEVMDYNKNLDVDKFWALLKEQFA